MADVRRTLGSAAIAIFLIVLLIWSIGQISPGPPERFVIIVADAMRADHLGCYGDGGDLTPNIDAFSARSIRFSEAWSAGAWTLPSNCALLTGRYAHEVADAEKMQLGEEAKTLAEYFREAGYKTAVFSATPIVSPIWKMAQGFDTVVFDEPLGQDDPVLRQALAWMEENRDERYFLLVYFFDPHEPYDPNEVPVEWRDRWAAVRPIIRAGQVPVARGRRLPIVRSEADGRLGRNQITTEEMEILHALYRADIRDVDARIGQILESIGRDKRTVVAVLSDHGEEWREHKGLRHKETLYRESLHIPMILHVPGVEAEVVGKPVSNLDIAPTFLSLAGIAAQGEMRGRRLLPTEEIAERPLFSEVLHSASFFDDTPAIEGYAVRLGDYALIHMISSWPEEGPMPPGGRWELFDMKSDPAQQEPLPIEGKGEELRRWLLDYEAAAKDPEKRPPPRAGLDEKQREQLRALGYIGD